VPLAGRPMVEWSIEAFGKAGVAAIVVACPPGHAYAPAPQILPSAIGGKGPGVESASPAGMESAKPPEVRVVEGGATRSASVANALAAVKTDLVAIHDAARPMVTPELVTGVVAALAADADADAAIAAAPVTDTIKLIADPPSGPPDLPKSRLSPSGGPKRLFVVDQTLDRAKLWAAQTPQVFRVGPLRKALEGDPEKIAAATDEAMLVEAAGGRVLIHPVEGENLKVTTPLDLRLAEQLLRQ
jgi:2-C-methyl-D-erythritol 4-phosphate cytidylyltransferase